MINRKVLLLKYLFSNEKFLSIDLERRTNYFSHCEIIKIDKITKMQKRYFSILLKINIVKFEITILKFSSWYIDVNEQKNELMNEKNKTLCAHERNCNE